MNKTIKTSSILAVAAFAGVSANTVYAEGVEVAPTDASMVVENAQTPITKADVEKAKEAVDTASLAVASAQTALDSASESTKVATQQVAEWSEKTKKAEENVVKATPETIKKAEEHVVATEANTKEAQDAVSNATNEAKEAQDKVKAQEAVVNQAIKTTEGKQTEVAQAQDAVKQAQQAFDGTNSKEVLDANEEAKKVVSEDKEALENAEAELTKAQEADAKRQEDVTKATEAQKKAETEANQAEQDYKTKKLTADETAKAQTEAEARLEKAQADVDSVNTIVMSKEYATALKDYWDLDKTAEERDAAEEVLRSLATAEAKKNTYKASEADKLRAFDVHSVTEAQAKELTLFASNLINQARKQVGTHLVKVSVDSAKEAQAHAEYYAKSDMTMWTFHHDTSDLDAKYGWVDEDWAGNWFNTSSWQNPTQLGKESMDDAKYYVYDAIVRWIFADDEWLHATSVVGTRNGTEPESYVGIGLSRLKDGSLSVNLNIFNTKYSNLTNFDTTEIKPETTTEDLFNVLEDAKREVRSTTTANKQAQQALQTATTMKDAKKQALDQATATLAEVEKIPVLTPNAQQNVGLLKTKLATDEEKAVEAQKAVDNLSADVQTKQANLNKATATLQEKLNDLKNVQDKENAEKATLAQLQTEAAKKEKVVIEKQKALLQAIDKASEASEELKALRNAPTILENAKKALADAEEKQTEAKKALEQAQTELKDAVEAQKKTLDEYNRLSNLYQLKQTVTLPAKHQVTPNRINKPLTYGAGQTSTTYGTATTQMKRVTKQKELPQTGTATTAVLEMIGTSILASLGVIGYRKQRKSRYKMR